MARPAMLCIGGESAFAFFVGGAGTLVPPLAMLCCLTFTACSLLFRVGNFALRPLPASKQLVQGLFQSSTSLLRRGETSTKLEQRNPCEYHPFIFVLFRNSLLRQDLTAVKVLY